MSRATIVLALLTTLAWVCGCAGGSSSSSSSSSSRRSSSSSGTFRYADAITAALERHPDGRPFAVETTTMASHAVVAVSLFDGDTVRGVYYDARDGRYVEDRAEPPVDDDEAASLTALRTRLESTSTTLRSTLRMVEGRYVVSEVTGVSLLMRLDRFLARVVTGTGGSAVEHYHDAVSGNASSLPDAGVDAGAADAGPDAGRDAGPIDAGRRR